MRSAVCHQPWGQANETQIDYKGIPLCHFFFYNAWIRPHEMARTQWTHVGNCFKLSSRRGGPEIYQVFQFDWPCKDWACFSRLCGNLRHYKFWRHPVQSIGWSLKNQTNKKIADKAVHLGLPLPGKKLSTTTPNHAHFAPLPRLMLREQR